MTAPCFLIPELRERAAPAKKPIAVLARDLLAQYKHAQHIGLLDSLAYPRPVETEAEAILSENGWPSMTDDQAVEVLVAHGIRPSHVPELVEAFQRRREALEPAAQTMERA